MLRSVVYLFKNHPSILSIKNEFRPTAEINIKAATVDQINKIIRNLDAKKATGPDKIPVKVVKMSAYTIDKHLTKVINNDFLRNSFSGSAKIAPVRPIFKKGERTEIGIYRPVSILNCFPKSYERFLHNQIASFSNEFLSDFISACRKGYSTNHVLISLIENWKTTLDKNLFTGAVLMDLSRAFDCIPHNLLIAKLHAYGLSFDTVTFLNLHLKDRKQNVTINSIFSASQNILSGVPQGYILGPILFNIFLSDLFLCIKKSDLHNFADDNTITATCNTLTGLLKTLEQESESAVSWFKQNGIIVNADKFQAIILNKKEGEAKYKLTIDNNDIESTKSVKELGITIDDRLRFDKHISNLCSKAAMQLNALGRLQKYMGKPEKVAIVNSFFMQVLTIAHWSGILVIVNRSEKLRKSKKVG